MTQQQVKTLVLETQVLARNRSLKGIAPCQMKGVCRIRRIPPTVTAKVMERVTKVTETVMKVTETVTKVTERVTKVMETVTKVTETVTKVTETVMKVTETVTKVIEKITKVKIVSVNFDTFGGWDLIIWGGGEIGPYLRWRGDQVSFSL